jgi:hypothetical protein
MQEDKIPSVSGLSKLRNTWPADIAPEVWKAAEARRSALKKVGETAKLLTFDQDGLEMASGAIASAYHAYLFAKSGAKTVLDLCAGLGLDTIAFAARGIAVIAFEKDPARCLLLQENIRLLDLTHKVKVICDDVTSCDLPAADAAFFDPARRSGTRRWTQNSEETDPPLSFISRIHNQGIPTILTKLSPAVDRDVAQTYDGDLQFVSIGGECREALLTTGRLNERLGINAIMLPERQCFTSLWVGKIALKHGDYIWEPDPAVIRAGLTGELAASLNGWQCDPHNDYFFSDERGFACYATCYKVIHSFAYSRRALQEALAGVGHVIFKQRGFPQSIEEVKGQLKLSGIRTALVILAGFNREKFAFVVERVSASSDSSRQ